MRTNKPILVALLFGILPGTLFADKIILKNGKVIEGRVMGETHWRILISASPDNRPRFYEKSEVLTIVRDQPDPPVIVDRWRYVTVGGSLGGNVFSSDRLQISPGPDLALRGGFRFHPLAEIDGALEWYPALSGTLAVSDGTHLREYERFGAYSGGFDLRVFPFYRKTEWGLEPYLVGGYRWVHLMPKNTEDSLKGQAYRFGFGAERLIALHWALDFRFTYERQTYDEIQFMSQEGTLTSPIRLNHYGFSAGLSYRFL